jgi:hypothetical protein
MTNEEIIDAFLKENEKRTQAEIDHLKKTLFMYDRLKFIRQLITFNTILFWIVLIILLYK